MKNHNFNEKGLTLVEVLASLVILGIVFIGFMIIFPQMTLFNKKTEIKLETMNLARQEMAYIQSIPFVSDNPLDVDVIKDKYRLGIKNGTLIEVNFDENGYKYEVDFDTGWTLPSDGHPENIALYKVHLKVLDGGKVNSETLDI